MFLAAQHELLLQIIERPDDDALRLVLADRLNEQGDPLGELISVQIALDRMARGAAHGDWMALKRREHELMRRHSAEWHQAAAPFARSLGFRRGLPHTLYCSADALLSDGGLTVLAPIHRLELEQVGAEQLEEIFQLPLLRRIGSLGLMGIRRFAGTRPPPPPPNVTKLDLGLDGLEALAHAVELGFLEGIEELALGARWLGPDAPLELMLPACVKLKHVTFTGLYAERQADELWLRALKQLLDDRPSLVVGWRGIDYDAQNIGSMLMSLEPQFMDDPLVRPASEYNRESFGAPGSFPSSARALAPAGAEQRDEVAREPSDQKAESSKLDTGSPSTVELHRRPDGSLLLSSRMRPDLSDVMQSLSLDASVHLQLQPSPHVLTARAFTAIWDSMLLRYEPWSFRTLEEVGLPLPLPIALSLTVQLAHALRALRSSLREVGIAGWPQALSRDFVLLGLDGTLKLLPPLMQCSNDDRLGDRIQGHRDLGLPLESDLAGTDDGILKLLGSALLHLLAGTPVSHRVRPSAMNPEWKVLDPLVDGCVASKRAQLYPSLDVFLDAVNHTGLVASQDAVAKAVQPKQDSQP